MGLYVGVHTALIGLYGFAAIYHLVLWWQSRRSAVLLLFALHCTLFAIFSADIVALLTARTPAEGQRDLDLRAGLGLLVTVTSVWLFSLIAGVRARRFLGFMTSALLGLVVANALQPLTGTVTAVERIVTSWGDTVSILHRESPSPWLPVAYALVLAVDVFGLVCAARLWPRDRVGGVLLAVVAGGDVAVSLWGARIDASVSQSLYVGGTFSALWVLLMAAQVARDYRLRGERLGAAERRFRAIFDQTFQFIGLLALDGTLLEVNRTALRFAGLRAEEVIGKPFWETAWWRHSSALQGQLRDAIRAAATGETVRFEATHPAADGRLHHVDFSVKPVHDEAGKVVLLIPEGRDVTKRKMAEQALEESHEQLRRLAGGLLMAREEERTKIAREIHDVLGQTLTALKMDAAWIASRVPGAEPAIRAKLAGMAGLIDESVTTVRRIATDLRPGVLDDLGLAAAIEWQAQEFERRTGIRCTLRAGVDEDGLDPLVSTAVFRIFQESLTNVARHSRASCVAGTLERQGGDLVLEVRDDGIGITPAQASDARSIGLAGMRERAQLVGGTFSIAGAAGAGTTIHVQIPRRAVASA